MTFATDLCIGVRVVVVCDVGGRLPCLDVDERSPTPRVFHPRALGNAQALSHGLRFFVVKLAVVVRDGVVPKRTVSALDLLLRVSVVVNVLDHDLDGLDHDLDGSQRAVIDHCWRGRRRRSRESRLITHSHGLEKCQVRH
jgi:hypothetical protein